MKGSKHSSLLNSHEELGNTWLFSLCAYVSSFVWVKVSLKLWTRLKRQRARAIQKTTPHKYIFTHYITSMNVNFFPFVLLCTARNWYWLISHTHFQWLWQHCFDLNDILYTHRLCFFLNLDIYTEIFIYTLLFVRNYRWIIKKSKQWGKCAIS